MLTLNNTHNTYITYNTNSISDTTITTVLRQNKYNTVHFKAGKLKGNKRKHKTTTKEIRLFLFFVQLFEKIRGKKRKTWLKEAWLRDSNLKS